MTNSANMALAGIILIAAAIGVGITLLGLHVVRVLSHTTPPTEATRLSRIEDIHGISAHALRASQCEYEASAIAEAAWYSNEVQE